MKEYIEERAVEIANYIIDHNATVRQTAKKLESARVRCIRTSPTVWKISTHP